MCSLNLGETRQSLTPKGPAPKVMTIAVSIDSAISLLEIQPKEILQKQLLHKDDHCGIPQNSPKLPDRVEH